MDEVEREREIIEARCLREAKHQMHRADAIWKRAIDLLPFRVVAEGPKTPRFDDSVRQWCAAIDAELKRRGYEP